MEFPATYEDFCESMGRRLIRFNFSALGIEPPPDVLEGQFRRVFAEWRADHLDDLQWLKVAAEAALQVAPEGLGAVRESFNLDVDSIAELGAFFRDGEQAYLLELRTAFQNDAIAFVKLMHYFVELGPTSK
ncbi:MAG TPA: hypothetical protein VFH06_03505 [Candidatus Saccharimonadales bacterium]|nr:hypothetical protein [Candidatus Saccharimonadales bacterium]